MFSVPSRIRYALRALIKLGEHAAARGPLALHQIASEEKIPVKYLESIFTQLRRAGIVQSVRGAEGGYLLARDPEAITILEILNAVEGPVLTVDCLQFPDRCPQNSCCRTRTVWDELQDDLEDFFGRRTLASMSVATGQKPGNRR